MSGSLDSTPPSCKALPAHLVAATRCARYFVLCCDAPEGEGAATRHSPGDGHQHRCFVNWAPRIFQTDQNNATTDIYIYTHKKTSCPVMFLLISPQVPPHSWTSMKWPRKERKHILKDKQTPCWEFQRSRPGRVISSEVSSTGEGPLSFFFLTRTLLRLMKMSSYNIATCC